LLIVVIVEDNEQDILDTVVYNYLSIFLSPPPSLSDVSQSYRQPRRSETLLQRLLSLSHSDKPKPWNCSELTSALTQNKVSSRYGTGTSCDLVVPTPTLTTASRDHDDEEERYSSSSRCSSISSTTYSLFDDDRDNGNFSGRRRLYTPKNKVVQTRPLARKQDGLLFERDITAVPTNPSA
jgi:hypothetical protein